MYHIKSNGKTPHQDALGTKYKSTILKFAETAMFKHPVSSTSHMTGGRRARKSKSLWEKGIFLGKTYESDEFLMGTSLGVHLVRTIRRLPVEDQADKDLLSTIVGVPWDRKIGQIGRPKKEITVVIPVTPNEVTKESVVHEEVNTDEKNEKKESEVVDATGQLDMVDSGDLVARMSG